MSGHVLGVEKEGGILTLRMDRPDKRNALNGAMVEALIRGLDGPGGGDDVRVILLRGEGPDFCAGADLAELEATMDQAPEESLADARRLGGLFLAMRRHPRPIVAAVQGRALAGGCGLATACDLVLARDDAELGYPEVHLGFVPAMVMAILRRKLTEGRAFELVSMGERIGAREAHRLGLVNRIFPAAEFEDGVAGFARELARRPSSAVTLIKELLYELDDLPFDEGIEAGARVNVEARSTEACREGVGRFLARKSSP
mgnify:CR=1 FL=1